MPFLTPGFTDQNGNRFNGTYQQIPGAPVTNYGAGMPSLGFQRLTNASGQGNNPMQITGPVQGAATNPNPSTSGGTGGALAAGLMNYGAGNTLPFDTGSLAAALGNMGFTKLSDFIAKQNNGYGPLSGVNGYSDPRDAAAKGLGTANTAPTGTAMGANGAIVGSDAGGGLGSMPSQTPDSLTPDQKNAMVNALQNPAPAPAAPMIFTPGPQDEAATYYRGPDGNLYTADQVKAMNGVVQSAPTNGSTGGTYTPNAQNFGLNWGGYDNSGGYGSDGSA
jgi:hypothetical protein